MVHLVGSSGFHVGIIHLVIAMDSMKEAVAGALRLFLASPAACAAIGALRPSHFSAQMLRQDRERGEGDTEGATSRLPVVSSVFYGLRGGHSYAEQLADVICEWRATRKDPVTRRTELERDELLHPVPTCVTSSGVISVDASAGERVQQAPIDLVDAFVQAAIQHNTEEHRDGARSDLSAATRALVDALGGARGLLTLIGHAQTVGSVAVAPLTRAQCISSFQRRRSDREPLSVGARALAKHCQRVVSTDGGSEDDASSAWGVSELRGNDASKNARALEVLTTLLDDAVWKNVHALPPFKEESSVVTMEVRNSRGYGARWEIRGGADDAGCEDGGGYAFRGFLEPPMADGHERRWRH